MFALADVNSFYASCEAVFRPDLKGRPIVVLSNNDGCVIARNTEAKLLGIKMGAPFFKMRRECEQHNVVIFSSNYALYADMSIRVMTVLEEMSPKVEIYSIDEAFLNLDGVSYCKNLEEFGREVKDKVYKWTGLRIGVGIGPTKTLALYRDQFFLRDNDTAAFYTYATSICLSHNLAHFLANHSTSTV
ncbi:UmuC domain-containing protein [Rouxiella silvae]